ncbi:MAG TPA: nucleotidyltransferase domain-containing protein [Candidatus Paceibacterota bacterium]|mgnify:CR=1 FL=1|nr:nucleotidyltransferase domain-containing protein [Candidatus Paceibacterota bacterium]HMP18881.1 nucleotidyltransferase domain-containing protein [Candidatus Paceibacterota bacterium]HMP85042.1 nucleotidyltransferase domain-containing protein [Candidatus Paceibacterota bacterium]
MRNFEKLAENKNEGYPGISIEQINSLSNIFRNFEKIGSVTLFGSRITGEHKDNSDLDIALTGAEGKKLHLSDMYDTIHRLVMEQTGLDVHIKIISEINNPALLHSIKDQGVVIYQR